MSQSFSSQFCKNLCLSHLMDSWFAITQVLQDPVYWNFWKLFLFVLLGGGVVFRVYFSGNNHRAFVGLPCIFIQRTLSEFTSHANVLFWWKNHFSAWSLLLVVCSLLQTYYRYFQPIRRKNSLNFFKSY